MDLSGSRSGGAPMAFAASPGLTRRQSRAHSPWGSPWATTPIQWVPLLRPIQSLAVSCNSRAGLWNNTMQTHARNLPVPRLVEHRRNCAKCRRTVSNIVPVTQHQLQIISYTVSVEHH